jgi:hypothetical protein
VTYGVTALNCTPSFFLVLDASKVLDQQADGLLLLSRTMARADIAPFSSRDLSSSAYPPVRSYLPSTSSVRHVSSTSACGR